MKRCLKCFEVNEDTQDFCSKCGASLQRSTRMNEQEINIFDPLRNPKMNPMINPNMDPTLNPDANMTINPKMNPDLNPMIKRTMSQDQVNDLKRRSGYPILDGSSSQNNNYNLDNSNISRSISHRDDTYTSGKNIGTFGSIILTIGIIIVIVIFLSNM